MAKTGDIVYLAVTILILGCVVGAILFVVKQVSEFMSTTKAKLKAKGYDVSHHGIAVQTQKRLDHEDYVDVTQRGLLKVLGASSYGKATDDGSAPVLHKSKSTNTSTTKSRTEPIRRKSDHK